MEANRIRTSALDAGKWLSPQVLVTCTRYIGDLGLKGGERPGEEKTLPFPGIKPRVPGRPVHSLGARQTEPFRVCLELTLNVIYLKTAI
jgi:hypothetical protein